MSKTTNRPDPLIALADMQIITCESLQRIRAVAKCALRSLETESGVRDLEAIAWALKSIILDADIASMDVSQEAENHGIQNIDEAFERRFLASTAAHSKTQVAKG